MAHHELLTRQAHCLEEALDLLLTLVRYLHAVLLPRGIIREIFVVRFRWVRSPESLLSDECTEFADCNEHGTVERPSHKYQAPDALGTNISQSSCQLLHFMTSQK